MPELPEVESAVRRLRIAASGKTIAKVSVLHPALKRKLSPARARSLRVLAFAMSSDAENTNCFISTTVGRSMRIFG